MTIMHTSCHTDVSTADYYSLHTKWKLHHCVMDVKQQLYDLAKSQLPITQLVCHDQAP